MIDKRLNNIKCSDVDTTSYEANKINLSHISGLDIDFLKLYACIAERESQKYGSMLNAYIAPFGR